MSTANPIAEAYDRALSRCGEAALAVEEAERVLQAAHTAYDHAHAQLNAAHDAMDEAGLLPKVGRPVGHNGIDLPMSEPENLRRKRLRPGDFFKDRRRGAWDEEDETTD